MQTLTMQRPSRSIPPTTMMEVFKSLPEGTLVQLIENELVMTPAPLDVHQEVLGDVFVALANFVKRQDLGKVRIAPYDVFLDDHNAFQPDIVFVSSEKMHLIRKNGLHGAPDLVIEILSPSTGKYDLHQKKDVYERCGVQEYWVINPETKAAQGLRLVNNKFTALAPTEGHIRSKLLKTEIHY